MFFEYEEEKNVLLLGHDVGLLLLLRLLRLSGSADTTCTVLLQRVVATTAEATETKIATTTRTKTTTRRTTRASPHQNDINDVENEQQREHSCFDLETFVKDVSERLHVDDDSID